ncbi:MAG: pectate lyase [Kiritimatiellia bacterium]|nr:pectate lyase [Kiritimatiellia bacterium]
MNRIRLAILIAAAGALPLGAAEPFILQGDWWKGPAEPTRSTTLVCRFDDPERLDADFARDRPETGGFGMTFRTEGLHGGAAEIRDRGGHLHFIGGGNLSPRRATLRMRVRGSVWADPSPRWLFEARAADRIGILREPGKLSLVFGIGREDRILSRLDLEIGDADPDSWHSVVASWDRRSGRGWIAFNGKGVSGPMTFSQDPRSAFVFFVGSGWSARQGGLNDAGLAFDDLALYDLPLPSLDAPPEPLPGDHEAFLADAEAAARRTLATLRDLQRPGGGWQTLYTWPTRIGSSAQGREWMDFDDYLDNDKGNGSPRTAAYLLYGYQVLGDPRDLDAALRTGEFLLAAQDERGYWLHGYRMTPRGLIPAVSARNAKFQDQVQAHPILFLEALYRETGDRRFRDAVVRAGEFYLAAQNPNGSWPHHVHLETGAGTNMRGQPGGGEINDEAINDAIDMMALYHHLTGDPRYAQALRRAGDWLIAAQGETIPMWADQYDAENRPAWARNFEPPAYGVTATLLAARALRELYRFFGDERYLDPVRRTAAWAREQGDISEFLEPESGKAIAAWDYKIYFLDDPVARAYLDTVPIGFWYLRQSDLAGPLDRILESAADRPGPPKHLDIPLARRALDEQNPEALHPVIAAEAGRLREWVASLGSLLGHAAFAIESQNEAGVWVQPVMSNYIGSLGQGFSATVPRVNFILRYIERARIVRGEIDPVYRGDGDLKTMARPEPGWYDLN